MVTERSSAEVCRLRHRGMVTERSSAEVCRLRHRGMGSNSSLDTCVLDYQLKFTFH